MPKSVGRRVLDKLRGSSEADSARRLASPRDLEVDREQLLAAVGDVRTGGPTAMDHLANLLIGIDRTGDHELDALAASLLVAADPIVWKSLALATQRAWWDVPDWAKKARERVGQGESGGLALVVASFHPDGFVREAAVARLGEIDDAGRASCPRTADGRLGSTGPRTRPCCGWATCRVLGPVAARCRSGRRAARRSGPGCLAFRPTH